MLIQLSILKLEAGICQQVLFSRYNIPSKYITCTCLTITHKHRTDTSVIRFEGSDTIDTIFCTQSLLGSRCGYLLTTSQFDHMAAWIDLPFSMALGHASPPLSRKSLDIRKPTAKCWRGTLLPLQLCHWRL